MKKILRRILGVIFGLITLTLVSIIINDFIFGRSNIIFIIIKLLVASLFGIEAWGFLDKDFDEEN